MSKISKRYLESNCKVFGDHKKYLSRITKTLYYGKLPKSDSLSIPVTELAAELFSEAQRDRSLDRLHYNDAANITRRACVSPCSLVLAILYLERLKQCNPEYLLKTTPSDLFLVSLMVSSKFLFDSGEVDELSLDEWAASGDIANRKALEQLEINFLKAIDWKIYVNEQSFFQKLHDIETKLAKKQGCSRGFFTYTELTCLSSLVELHNIIQCFVAVSVILAATYTAGLLTIVGSVYLTSQIPGNCLQPKKLEDPITTVSIPGERNELKTDFSYKSNVRNVDAIDMLKTSILLASIKPCNRTNSSLLRDDSAGENLQFVSWDWWRVPAMVWLAKTSELVTGIKLPPVLSLEYHPFYLDNTIGKLQYDLEAQVDKATKTRIQDQMETSWHEEWIDTIKYGIIPYQYEYNNYIKS